MRKISVTNTRLKDVASPKGRFRMERRNISGAFGAGAENGPRHPFEVEHVTLPPGSAFCPYHSHSAEWEHSIFVHGEGRVRHPCGVEPVGTGDHVLFAPGEAHQIWNEGTEPLVYYVVANNCEGSDNCYYPDSDKWALDFGQRGGIVRTARTDYFDGEE